jgi:hypothetical protein
MGGGLVRLEALVREVDERFESIRRRNPGRMECGRGCTDCCRCRLSVTRIEAAFIRRGVARLPHPVRRELSERAHDPAREMCPALGASGRCEIYDSRPLACRVEGAPLRSRHPVPLIHPSRIDFCDKNFRDAPAGLLPDEDVIDRTRLTEKLRALAGNDDGERVPLAQVLAECV